MKPTLFKMKNRTITRESETQASIPAALVIDDQTIEETRPNQKYLKRNIYSMMARALSPRKPELNCTTPILSSSTSRYKKLNEARQAKYLNEMAMETTVQE